MKTILFLILTYSISSCALLGLRSKDECDIADEKAEGQQVYGCSSNLGVTEWYKTFECTDPNFKPIFKKYDTGHGYDSTHSTCADDNGNVWKPKHYTGDIFCEEKHKGQWLYVTGWSYKPTEHTEMNAKYYFQCDPSLKYPDPVSGTGSTEKVEYIRCEIDENLKTEGSSPPVCHTESES